MILDGFGCPGELLFYFAYLHIGKQSEMTKNNDLQIRSSRLCDVGSMFVQLRLKYLVVAYLYVQVW